MSSFLTRLKENPEVFDKSDFDRFEMICLPIYFYENLANSERLLVYQSVCRLLEAAEEEYSLVKYFSNQITDQNEQVVGFRKFITEYDFLPHKTFQKLFIQ